jgi:RNA polymerase sigma factor (sigma-70 family)
MRQKTWSRRRSGRHGAKRHRTSHHGARSRHGSSPLADVVRWTGCGQRTDVGKELLTQGDSTVAGLPASGLDPSLAAEGSERRMHVLAALRELPEEQREVLELGYFQGLSQTEIADVTGQPLRTLKTRMRLAMQKLREPRSMYRESTQ